MLEKEILPAADPQKEPLAGDLLDKLINLFRGEIQNELGDLNKKFAHFLIQPGEKVCTGIDWLNGIIQKIRLTVNRLHKKLEAQSSKQPWDPFTLSALANNIVEDQLDEIVATCKRYDKAMEQQRLNLGSDMHMTSGAEKVVCSYPKCENLVTRRLNAGSANATRI